jgi:hypothetical protein
MSWDSATKNLTITVCLYNRYFDASHRTVLPTSIPWSATRRSLCCVTVIHRWQKRNWRVLRWGIQSHWLVLMCWVTAPVNTPTFLLQGYLVNLPLQFLSSEVLTPNSTSVEGIMPTALWTWTCQQYCSDHFCKFMWVMATVSRLLAVTPGGAWIVPGSELRSYPLPFRFYIMLHLHFIEQYQMATAFKDWIYRMSCCAVRTHRILWTDHCCCCCFCF